MHAETRLAAAALILNAGLLACWARGLRAALTASGGAAGAFGSAGSCWARRQQEWLGRGLDSRILGFLATCVTQWVGQRPANAGEPSSRAATLGSLLCLWRGQTSVAKISTPLSACPQQVLPVALLFWGFPRSPQPGAGGRVSLSQRLSFHISRRLGPPGSVPGRQGSSPQRGAVEMGPSGLAVKSWAGLGAPATQPGCCVAWGEFGTVSELLSRSSPANLPQTSRPRPDAHTGTSANGGNTEGSPTLA